MRETELISCHAIESHQPSRNRNLELIIYLLDNKLKDTVNPGIGTLSFLRYLENVIKFQEFQHKLM